MNKHSVGGDLKPQNTQNDGKDLWKQSRNLWKRIKFLSYRLSQEKSFDEHMTILQKLVSECDYGDQVEMMITDKILENYMYTPIIDLVEEENMTLNEVIALLRAQEKLEIIYPINSLRTPNCISEEKLGNVESYHDSVCQMVSKEKIDLLINTFLKYCLSLNVVQGLLKINLSCTLSPDDKDYIQKRYLEELIELWLDEVSENVMDLCSDTTPFEVVNKLSNITCLQHCLTLGLNTPYNNLMKDLSKVFVPNKSLERKCTYQFILTTLTFMRLKTPHLNSEMDFYQNLIKCLKESKNVRLLCNLLNTSVLTESEDDIICFKKFLQEILKCDSVEGSIPQLKNAAIDINKHERYFFINIVKKAIEDYLKPFIIAKAIKDGRILLEVKGKHIVISEVLPKIETRSDFQEIEEVRAVNADVIHIDECLNPSFWHGKNIVVYAETAVVCTEKNITWDVSGKDANDENYDPAGTGRDGIGLDGVDGKQGESAGNILLIFDEIKNATNLNIVVNGGKGSRGQDGGKGKNGRDGDFITNLDFKKQFPPVANFFDSDKQMNLKTTMSSVKNDIGSAELHVMGRVVPVTVDWFLKKFDSCIENLQNLYFEVKTNKGCTILFSFYYGPPFTFCQSFLLHKGADGEPGKEGGKGGLGGKGGSAGDVIVQVNENSESVEKDIVIFAEKGEDGKPGQSGMHGSPGKSGKDCAYIDLTNATKPTYYLTRLSDSHRLDVNYQINSVPNSVYCPHNGQYAEICKKTKKINQNIKKTDVLNKFTFKEKQLNSVKVIRMKTISTKSILDQYERKKNIADIHMLTNLEKHIKDLDRKISEEEESQKQTAQETRIVRNVGWFSEKQLDLYINSVPLNTDHQETSVSSLTKDNLVSWAKGSPRDVQVWKDLAKIPISLEELTSLWYAAKFKLSSAEDEVFMKVSNIVKIKTILTVFENLQQLPIELITSDEWNMANSKPVSLKQNSLDVCKGPYNYSEIECYLYEDSTEKREDVINGLIEISFDVLVDIFNLFLNDGHCFLPKDTFDKYKKSLDCSKYVKEKNMRFKILPFLKSCKSHKMYEKLVEAVNKKGDCLELLINIEQYIHKDVLIEKMYDIYRKETKRTLKPGIKKNPPDYLLKKLQKGFANDIKQKGSLSVFYRELLARRFNTNIQLFTINDSNQMVLTYNHNLTANSTVQALIKNNKLFQLKLDEGLYKMNSFHDKKGQIHNKMEHYINFVTIKEEFDKIEVDYPSLMKDSNAVSKSVEICVKVNHMLMEDENIQVILNNFDLEEERTVLSSRLKMLKHEYAGYQSILHSIALHIECEGHILSVSELCCVINFTLKSLLESPPKINLVSWIIAAYHQTKWLTEFILLKLELKFKQLLSQDLQHNWRKYLNQTNKDIVMLLLVKLESDKSLDNVKVVEEVLYLLSHTSYNHPGLYELSLVEWKYLLKDEFWICRFKSIGCWTREQLRSVSFYLVTLENMVGLDSCESFFESVKCHLNHQETKDRKEIILRSLRHLTWTETSTNKNLITQLSKVDLTKWEEVLNMESCTIKQSRSIEQLNQLMKDSNVSNRILAKVDETTDCIERICSIHDFFKRKIEDVNSLKTWVSSLLSILEENKIKLSATSVLKYHRMDQAFRSILSELKSNFLKVDRSQSDDDFLRCNILEIVLATVCASIFIVEKVTLRNTQLLAILIFLKTGGNLLGQVQTGEGKSFIIISVAIMKALSGSKVDIITSSHLLAKRDSDACKKICNIFDINVGHNCSENTERRMESYSNCQIVYGELAYFQRDYLLDKVYDINILGNRTFETILVDEVDSMLLDKGNNVLYLSHEIPGLDKLEPLFVFIWRFLNSPHNSNHDEVTISVDQLRDTILYEMYDLIEVEDIQNLDTSIEKKYVLQTWAQLLEKGAIDSTGKVLEVSESVLDDISKDCIHGEHLKYLFNRSTNKRKAFEIPNYLKPFAKDHFDEWIDSAINAMNLKINVDYVVDVDRSDDSTDRNPNIIIVDRDTGTDMTNSHWDQGIHQFLQLKHGCRISPLSFKAVFISNVSFFKHYKTLIGLTGTLGSMSDRKFLEKLYEAEFVTIPTAKAKDFIHNIPILCNSTDEWATRIFDEVYNITSARSALIICESVNDVLFLKKHILMSLKDKPSKRKVSSYTRDYEKFSNTEDLDSNNIIISTNLAGRGTDIKLTKELVSSGGLHVCLSYLPNNCRIEEQAFGRAARNGESGSGQLIFKHSGQNNALKAIDMKKERDLREVLRISDVKKYYETNIKRQEEWFSDFKMVISELRSSKHCNEIKSVILMASLDQWALWLEKNKNSASSSPIHNLIDGVSKLKNVDFKTWSDQIQDPFRLTKLGLLYLDQGNNELAIQLFDRVIKNEPSFSEAAYYYRVCARLSKDDIERKNFPVKELKVVETMLQKRIHDLLISAKLINWLKTNNKMASIQTDSFEEQQQEIININKTYIDSIHRTIGYPVTPHSFLDIDSQLQLVITSNKVKPLIFNDMINSQIIIQKVKKELSVRDLDFFLEYGMCPKMIKSMLECRSDNGLELERNVSKWFRESHDLPSREMFWDELVSVGKLIQEEKYVFVNIDSLNQTDPSLVKQMRIKASKIKPSRKNQISLFTQEELGQLEENFTQNHLIFYEDQLLEQIGMKKFELIKQDNSTLFNRLAVVCNSVEDVELKYFDSITQKDFLKVGIPAKIADCIIKDLLDQKIISAKEKENQTQYLLCINCEDINKIELNILKAYISDVKQLLSHCFAFRIALQKLEYVIPLCQGDYSKTFLPLKANLDKCLWNELVNYGIIEREINYERVTSKNILEIYPKSMNEEGYVNMFAKLYDKDQSRNIVEELIKTTWLKPRGFYTSKPGICYTSYGLNTQFSKESSLPPILRDNYETIQLVLSNNLNLSKMVEQIVKCLRSGGIHSVDTPCLSLTCLETVLKESRLPTSEVDRFTLNGFDKVFHLEEKKYSKRMLKNTAWITLLGVIEIAVGAFLEFTVVGNPFGLYFLSQGLDDLIFATSCVFTGHFSWQQYLTNKVLSVVAGSLSLAKAFTSIRTSSFAANTAGMSLTTFKDKCCSMLSKAKTVFGWFFKSNATNRITRGEIITQLCKKVVVHTARGIALGASYGLVEQIVENKLDELSELLTNLIEKDIDKAVANHPISQSAVDLCKILGEKETLIVIKKVLDKILKRAQSELGTSFDSMDLRHVKTLIQRTASKEFKKERNQTSEMQIVMAVAEVCKAIFSAWSHLQLMSNIVSCILNDLNEELKIEMDTSSKCQNNLHPCTDLDEFKFDILDQLQSSIRSTVSEHIKKKILTPILFCAQSYLIEYSDQIIGKTRTFFSTDDIPKSEQNKLRPIKQNKKTITGNSHPELLNTEFYRISFELLKTRKNKSLIALKMLQTHNPAMDSYGLEIFFSMIPLVLEQNGIKVPPLKIELKEKGIEQTFHFGDTKHQAPVVCISTGMEFTSNLKNNKLLMKDVFQFLSNSLLEKYPEFKGSADILQEICYTTVCKHFESYSSSSYSEEDLPWDCTSLSYKSSKLNTESEMKIPYQHFLCDGAWKFSSYVDVDLREKDKITNLYHVQDHISRGFETALQKINNHIHNIQKRLRSFNLILDDFSTTKHEIVPPPPDNTTELFKCYPVQYELIVPVMLTDCNKLVDFAILLSLRNETPLTKPQPHSPKGPCIFYEINPASDSKFLHKGLRGHVLLNIDCINASFSLNNCHTAGELIVASVKPNPRKKSTFSERGKRSGEEPSVVVIVESLFKHIGDHIDLPKHNFDFKVYLIQSIENLTTVVMSSLEKYKDVKCIVLFLSSLVGGDEFTIVDQICYTVKEIQTQLQCVEVVLYSLPYVKEPAMKNFWKIFKINEMLKIQCEKNLTLVDINEVIGPKDIKKNGIHLNKSGCRKLGKHLSVNCKQILNPT